MIEIEGRVLAGLDEFMLRLGHLVMLCRVAYDVGGSWPRIHREAAERLTALVPIASDENCDVANYLATKGLCRNVSGEATSEIDLDSYAYPELELYVDVSGQLQVRSGDGTPRVTWQDKNLAARPVRSRVGALTSSARGRSKTGLSHICDWAQLLDLIDSTGQLTPMGRLLVTATGAVGKPFDEWNPYVLGPERIIPAYQFFRMDVDLFARLAPLLGRPPAPLDKSTCRRLFVQALRAVVADSEESKTLSPRYSYELFGQVRDLERAARKANAEIDETSTAWHRAASRVETLTDLGFLEKGIGGDSEKYKYIYYPTYQLSRAVETMHLATNGDQWIERYLIEVVLGVSDDQAVKGELEDHRFLRNLRRIVDSLRLPTTQLPIDCLVLGIAYLGALESTYWSAEDLRARIEVLPSRYPSMARLARGREGTRAEYISLNLRELPGHTENGSQ